MNIDKASGPNRVMMAAIATALAMGVAACQKNESQPAPDRSGQNMQQPGDNVGGRIERSAESAEKRIEGVADAAEKRVEQAGKSLDDAAVTAKVKSALIAEPNLKSNTIDVDTVGGVVILKGTADSQEIRRKAEQVATAVEGVRSVRNELVVIRG